MHDCPRTLGEHGCAECLRNRSYHKRVWCHRLELESRLHAESSFLTLTYSDDNLPVGGTLVPNDVTLWLKRFRAAIAPVKLRYYVVGEYGDTTRRPHYHAALFGVGINYADIVRETWGFGHIMLGDLNIKSIRYISGYITKKMTVKSDPRLEGRYPEFVRMSRRPGIGSGFVPTIAAALDSEQGEQLAADDVPTSLRVGGKVMPLGRYMRSKLRDEVVYEKVKGSRLARLLGGESIYNSAKRLVSSDQRLSDLFEVYENSSSSSKMTFLQFLTSDLYQRNLNTEALFKLHKKGIL